MEDQQQTPPQENTKKKVIRSCPHCGQNMEIKNPWKALFRMPTLNEWVILFMLIMMGVAAYAYKHDVGVCQEFVKNFDYYCSQRGNGGMLGPPNYSGIYPNFSMGVIIINDTINYDPLNNQSNITSDR